MMETLEQLETEIADMQREINDLRDKIHELDNRRSALLHKQGWWKREAARLRAIRRETVTADRWQQWRDDYAAQAYRWSPRWWASEGWGEVAEQVIGLDWRYHNLSLLFAAFAELDDLDQFVLEQRYGIGTPKLTLDALAEGIPYADFTDVGVSRERARQRVIQTLRRLRGRYYKAKAATEGVINVDL